MGQGKGSLLNGKSVTKAPLAPGDVISVGHSSLVFAASSGLFGGLPTAQDQTNDDWIRLEDSASHRK